MEINLKHVGLGLMALAALGLAILYMTGQATTLIPIDQSLCPPEVGIAEDGTCGIYVGREITGWAYAAMAVAVLGVVSFLAGLVKERRVF